MFADFSLESQLKVLDRYQQWIDVSTFDENNPEFELASRLIKLQAWINNYLNYLNWWELDKQLSLEVALDSRWLEVSFPWTLTSEQIQTIAEVEEFVIEKAEQELHASEQELHASEQELHTSEQELHTSEQELHASEQELHASEQELQRKQEENRRKDEIIKKMELLVSM
jgi:hypothetical protein